MIFNSITFFIFFSIVFVCCLLFTHKVQNIFLLFASYFFYATFDYRFLTVIFSITVIDFFLSKSIWNSSEKRIKKYLLYTGLLLNIGILCYLKYLNFLIENFIFLLKNIGVHAEISVIKIILPVGISFYIFKSISYLVDVFRGETPPVKNIFDYALYISFFPQIIAGPISRGKELIPQIIGPRIISFDKISIGFYYISSGLFLKIFMSDNLSRLINPVFSDNQNFTVFQYIIAGYAFSFQIYGDFAGYSWIAKGLGLIIGFNMIDNFNLPYFSKNPQQFWRRWHISLSNWLRDYLYIPLGGNRNGRIKTYRNLLITMVIGGIWHGAEINFIIWGFFHGILLIIHHLIVDLTKKFIKNYTVQERIANFIKIIIFFNIITISWLFFRISDINQLFFVFKSFFYMPYLYPSKDDVFFLGKIIFYILPVFFMQSIQYIQNDKFVIFKFPAIARAVIYVIAFYLYVIFGATNAQNFIYAQF